MRKYNFEIIIIKGFCFVKIAPDKVSQVSLSKNAYEHCHVINCENEKKEITRKSPGQMFICDLLSAQSKARILYHESNKRIKRNEHNQTKPIVIELKI